MAKYLESSNYNSTNGWFNPESFCMFISGNFSSLSELNKEQLQVLNHELNHYLHFTSTTLGINFIFTNLQVLNKVYEWKIEPKSEKRVSEIHQEVLGLERHKAYISVPSYYYEKGDQYSSAFRPEDWVVTYSLGSFFTKNGDVSDVNFIMQRFGIHDITKDKLVARLSLGTKYLFEHLIKFIDILIDADREGLEQAYEIHLDNAYYGPLLPYSALALVFANKKVLHLNAFIASAIVSHLALMFPSEWTDEIKDFKSYIEEKVNSTFPVQNYHFKKPHPSVVTYGLVEKMAELDAANTDFIGMIIPDKEGNYQLLNDYIEKVCSSLNFSLNTLFHYQNEEIQKIKTYEVYEELEEFKSNIIEELTYSYYEKKCNFAKYIVSPHRSKFTPRILNEGHSSIQGNFYDNRYYYFLIDLLEHRDELLRFHYERNLV